MIMFLSSFFGIIDSKTRLAIPSSYRSTITETKEKVYLFKMCIVLCSYMNFQVCVFLTFE